MEYISESQWKLGSPGFSRCNARTLSKPLIRNDGVLMGFFEQEGSEAADAGLDDEKGPSQRLLRELSLVQVDSRGCKIKFVEIVSPEAAGRDSCRGRLHSRDELAVLGIPAACAPAVPKADPEHAFFVDAHAVRIPHARLNLDDRAAVRDRRGLG